MKSIFKLLALILTVSLVSCQNDEIFDDNTSSVEVNEPAEGVFRFYPKDVTTRASNLIYIDIEPNNRQVYYNLKSNTYTAQQIAANYKIEFFSSFQFVFLSEAFDNIESYPVYNSPVSLYFLMEAGNDKYVYHYLGVQGEYTIRQASTSRWYLDMYNLPESSGPSNGLYTFTIPVRIKLTHKFGGPSFTYDLIQTSKYWNNPNTINWSFDIP